MQYAFQILPHPNVRYQDALKKLGGAELTQMLHALGHDITWMVENIGGTDFFIFDSPELSEEELAYLAPMSSTYLWVCRTGKMLTPLARRTEKYLPGEMSEVLKYKGKTNAAFTALMLNLARAESPLGREKRPLTVLDPMCGKGTTLYCALEQGMNAVGVDRDRKDLKEARKYRQLMQTSPHPETAETHFYITFSKALLNSEEARYAESNKILADLAQTSIRAKLPAIFICSIYSRIYTNYMEMGDMSNALHYIRLCMQTAEKNRMMHYVPETLRDMAEIQK